MMNMSLSSQINVRGFTRGSTIGQDSNNKNKSGYGRSPMSPTISPSVRGLQSAGGVSGFTSQPTNIMSSYMNLQGDRTNTNNARAPLSPRYNAENSGSLARFGDIYSNNGRGFNATTTSSGVRIQTVSQMSESNYAGSTVQIQNMLVRVGDRQKVVVHGISPSRYGTAQILKKNESQGYNPLKRKNYRQQGTSVQGFQTARNSQSPKGQNELKYLSGYEPVLEENSVDLNITQATMSPPVIKKPYKNYSKVPPRAQSPTDIAKLKLANSKMTNSTVTSPRTSVKPYNPNKDKFKIVKGDLFDIKGRLGIKQSQHSIQLPQNNLNSARDSKSKRQQSPSDLTLDYTDPDRVLGQVQYETTKNLLLQWNPFIIQKDQWASPTNIQGIQDSLTDLKQTLQYTLNKKAMRLEPIGARGHAHMKKERYKNFLHLLKSKAEFQEAMQNEFDTPRQVISQRGSTRKLISQMSPLQQNGVIKKRYRMKPEEIIESQGVTQIETEEFDKDLNHVDSTRLRNDEALNSQRSLISRENRERSLSAHLIQNDNINKDSSTYLMSLQENGQLVTNVTVKQYAKQTERIQKLNKPHSNENVKVVESPRDPGDMMAELLSSQQPGIANKQNQENGHQLSQGKVSARLKTTQQNRRERASQKSNNNQDHSHVFLAQPFHITTHMISSNNNTPPRLPSRDSNRQIYARVPDQALKIFQQKTETTENTGGSIGDLEIVGKIPISQGSAMLKSQRRSNAVVNDIKITNSKTSFTKHNTNGSSKPLIPGNLNQKRNSMMQPKTIDTNDQEETNSLNRNGSRPQLEGKDLMVSVSQKQNLIMKPNRGSQMSIKNKQANNEPSKLEMWSNKSGLDFLAQQNNNGFTTVEINNRFKKSEMSFNFKGAADRIESGNPDQQLNCDLLI